MLGRTGSGKTALLQRLLNSSTRAIELSPQDLALNYVSNSNILQFFEEAGVSLEIFYILLWRHIITVALLKMKYQITDESKQFTFLDTIKQYLKKDRSKERAIKYMEDWGGHFWEETEYRTKEFTRKLETELKGNAKINLKYAELGAEGARKLSDEEKIEVREAGAKVVDGVQVKELHDVISLLGDDIFTDDSQPYYIVIDKLDEDWVGDRIKSKLIKALIESIKSFRKVRP